MLGGPWSAVVLQSSEQVGDVTTLVQLNDLVLVEGIVTEFGTNAGRTNFGTTNTAVTRLEVLRQVIDPIQPIVLSARDLDPFPNSPERFESVLVRLEGTTASSPIGTSQEFAFFLQDSTGVAIAGK